MGHGRLLSMIESPWLTTLGSNTTCCDGTCRTGSPRPCSTPSGWPERYGLDFAFPAVFLALVAVQLRRRADWLVAIGAAVLAVALALILPGNWHIVVAGLAVSLLAASVLPVDAADEGDEERA